ncbi:DUF6318 family protein [Demequina maris]|uniref:DUF6318 family protein n=1 Tax=Demequina maris TaxID=1638982 RepID=UPI000784BC1F|nr:DUF6318 family protein [Demequina maris]
MRFIPGGRVARRAVAATMLAGVCVGVAACTGEPAPIVTESPTGGTVVVPTEAAASTPSAAPTALTDDELLAMMPEGSERADVYGAMMTATFFLEQYAPMFHTGDTRVWEALSAEGCDYCADALANAERVRDEGWTARGGEITVDAGQTQAALTSDSEASVLLAAELEAGRLLDSSGGVQSSSRAGAAAYGVRLGFTGGHWQVIGVASEDS